MLESDTSSKIMYDITDYLGDIFWEIFKFQYRKQTN